MLQTEVRSLKHGTNFMGISDAVALFPLDPHLSEGNGQYQSGSLANNKFAIIHRIACYSNILFNIKERLEFAMVYASALGQQLKGRHTEIEMRF